MEGMMGFHDLTMNDMWNNLRVTQNHFNQQWGQSFAFVFNSCNINAIFSGSMTLLHQSDTKDFAL